MKIKTRKFKVYDRVKVISKGPLEKMGMDKTVVVRKFERRYEGGHWYYVSNINSLAYWLVDERRLRIV